MKEMTNRQKQAVKTKKQILETSLKLMREQGFDGVTIKQICDEVNVSTGAFYHHLKSKEGIIIEGYSECDDYFNEYVINNLKSTNTIDKILEYIGQQAEYAEMLGVDIITQVYRIQLTSGNEFFLSQTRGLPKNLLSLIEQGQEEGLLRSDYEANKICKELLLISRGAIYNWAQSEGDFVLTDYCREIISHHLHYFIKKNEEQ